MDYQPKNHYPTEIQAWFDEVAKGTTYTAYIATNITAAFLDAATKAAPGKVYSLLDHMDERFQIKSAEFFKYLDEEFNSPIEMFSNIRRKQATIKTYYEASQNKINHPSHYGGDTTYEAIKVIEAWKLDFPLGNAVKYISRAGKKDPAKEIEDLEKAAWYLERKISQLKTNPNESR